MIRPDIPHEETIIELMREDPAYADELLAVALEEINEQGGREALLTALRCYAEAKGMSAIAQETGLSRESLYRALSTRGNPTLKTLLAVLNALGLRLGVERTQPTNATTA
ncbi:MAG: addiction module antidote protein [Porticoccaceae bacterium]|jgi:probable addiction module antidote protein|nr:putative addiction module antidote protein [Halothiobacillus sp.]